MTLFRWCTLTAVLAAVATTPSHANEDWWFDVEVVAFKRNTALTQLEEQFNLADSFDTPTTRVDVISAVVMPDISLIKQIWPHAMPTASRRANCRLHGLNIRR